MYYIHWRSKLALSWHFLSFVAKAQCHQILLQPRPRWAGKWQGRHLRLRDLRPRRSSDSCLDVPNQHFKSVESKQSCRDQHFEQRLSNRRCMKMYEDVLTCQLIPASCSVGKLPASILVNAFADIVIASGYHVPAACCISRDPPRLGS